MTIFCYMCLIFLLYIFFSKHGKIRLGGEKATSEFSTFSWLSCLFMAGCGIGLVFYCHEPILHYFSNPYYGKVIGSQENVAYSLTLFNWTINAWAQYGVLGVILAYFFFNGKRELKLSSIIPSKYPLWVRRTIDVIMALGVIAGLTTSLGLGISQIASGFKYVFDITLNPYLLMAAIGFVSTWSIYSGLKRGVKWLSNLSTILVIALLLSMIVISMFSLGIYDFPSYFFNGTGLLLYNFLSYNDFYNHTSDNWAASYPIFFDLWFAAWAAFVAVFIARISKGRTLREFIIGVVGFPILFTCIWFCIFGRLGLEYKEIIYDNMQSDISTAVFIFIQQLVDNTSYIILAGLILVIICLFFITSSDSGSYVIASLLTENKEVKAPEKIFWSLIQCLVAMALFYIGGLALVQSVSVIMGILVVALIIVGMWLFIQHIRKS